MIILNCEQGGPEWKMARLGIPTASKFDKIITKEKGELSKSSDGYAHHLIAEQVLGIPLDDAPGEFVERGQVLERKALAYYEMKRETDTTKVGFVLRDDRRVGCSPDSFVGDNGLLEIKCPTPHIHVSYLLDASGIGYRQQVQGQLWLCEREWIDTLSFHPDMPPALVRQERDDIYISKLERAVNTFIEQVADMKDNLIRRGLFKPENFNRAALEADQATFRDQWGGKLARDLHDQEASA